MVDIRDPAGGDCKRKREKCQKETPRKEGKKEREAADVPEKTRTERKRGVKTCGMELNVYNGVLWSAMEGCGGLRWATVGYGIPNRFHEDRTVNEYQFHASVSAEHATFVSSLVSGMVLLGVGGSSRSVKSLRVENLSASTDVEVDEPLRLAVLQRHWTHGW
ncbi:hypothetical protein RUM44_006180 [Polyplax serrata]|uniref:Uncharacterized protein n=1 Tax=Polyplax serrata TaxID=468196 RepID=A0ABR1AZ54_POLSC